MRQGRVQAICVSQRRGTEKKPVENAVLVAEWGIQGDAHAGHWHRQISLLSAEAVDLFNQQGVGVLPGAFGENILVEGIDLRTMPVGALLTAGDITLELTQIGKECHTRCQIYQRTGDCVMPREGVFARVVRGGTLAVGDEMIAEGYTSQRRAAVVTVSDRAARGERADESGPIAKELLEQAGYRVEDMLLIPDEQAKIESCLLDLCDRRQLQLVITTGGTGFSIRDVTPEATLAVAERNAPGVSEAIRAFSMAITPRAMLSRAVAALRGGTLLINLPGSPQAVRESLVFILPHLSHGLDILQGEGDG